MASDDKPRVANTRTDASAPGPAAVVVYATFPSREAALAVGRGMVEARVAGCINVLPAMTSVYVWEGATETAEEAVLIAKLPAEGADAAVAFIEARHAYDTPAILVIPVVGGAEKYLAWLATGVDTA